MKAFENGQVVVATKDQFTGCGKVKIHEGAIVMVADNEIDGYCEIKVWKSYERKQYNQTTDVNPNSLRLADDNEIDYFLSGIRNINLQKEHND